MPGFHAAGGAGQLGMFAKLAPTVLPDLLSLGGDMLPHLLVREPYEFAAWLAAERCQLPTVVHAIGVVSGSMRLIATLAGEPLADARAAADLPADPDLRSLYGHGLVTFYPSSLRFLQLPPPPVPRQLVRLPPPGPTGCRSSAPVLAGRWSTSRLARCSTPPSAYCALWWRASPKN